MIQKTEELYDAINTYAIKTLIYNFKQHNALILSNFFDDPSDLWVFEIAREFCRLSNSQIYVKCNFLAYLKFKYIKKYKFIKKLKKNNKIEAINIDCIIFENEMVQNFDTYLDTLSNIYYSYFRR